MKDIEDFKDEWRNEANSQQIRKMKKIKLPVGKKPSLKMISVRVSEDHQKKFNKLKYNKGTLIRPTDLMEYMIDYFYEEVYGEDK